MGQEQDVDISELMAAIDIVNGLEPQSGRVTVSASILSPISQQREENPEIGQEMRDGSVYAGLTPDGKQRIFAMPEDIGVTKTFNDVAKAVDKLNTDQYLGRDDWKIAGVEVLQVLQENQNEGKLRHTFKEVAEDDEDGENFYWSSTKNPNDPNQLHIIRFSDGEHNIGFKNYDYSEEENPIKCRAVRLVPVKSPAPGL